MTGRSRKRIYVFEKEAGFHDLLENSLAPEEASVSGFSKHLECIAEIAIKPCDLLIVDWDGCPVEGLNVIEQARRLTPWFAWRLSNMRLSTAIGHAGGAGTASISRCRRIGC
jgi:DNA-binding NtrC family response regulator